MKLLGKKGDAYTFQVRKKEKALLRQLLTSYPILPVSYVRDRAGTPDSSKEVALLEESLGDQQKENRQWVSAVLKDDRILGNGSEEQVTLQQSQIESLLQILNDVRVGSWVALGCPEAKGLPKLTSKNAANYWMMELAGHFQNILLSALDPHFTSFLSEL